MFPRSNHGRSYSSSSRDKPYHDPHDIPSDESDKGYRLPRTRPPITHRKQRQRKRVPPRCLDYEWHIQRVCSTFATNPPKSNDSPSTSRLASTSFHNSPSSYSTPLYCQSLPFVEPISNIFLEEDQEPDPVIHVDPLYKRWTVFGIQRPSWHLQLKCFETSRTSCEAFKDLVLDTIKQCSLSKDQTQVFNKYKYCKVVRVLDVLVDDNKYITKIVGTYCETRGVPCDMANTVITLALHPTEVGTVLTPLISPSDVLVMLNYTKTKECSDSFEHDYICIHITANVIHKQLPIHQIISNTNYNVNNVIVNKSTASDADFYIFCFHPRQQHLRSLKASFPTVHPEPYSSPSSSAPASPISSTANSVEHMDL